MKGGGITIISSLFATEFRIMNISKSDIETIATLAQLDVEDSVIDSFVQEMADILSMIHQMQEIDTSEIKPMPHPQDIELRLRMDEITEPDQRSELQLIAPATKNGLYLVPKVLD